MTVPVVFQFQERYIPTQLGMRLSGSQLGVFARRGRFATCNVRFQRLPVNKVQASEFGVQLVADGAEHWSKSTAYGATTDQATGHGQGEGGSNPYRSRPDTNAALSVKIRELEIFVF